MKQLIYLALVIVCGAALLKWVSKRPVPTGGGWKTLTPEEAKARLDSGDAVTLLDVRTEAEYEESHIPGAILIPHDTVTTAAEDALPDKGQLILVYCRSGNRSKQASQALVDLGYTNVVEFGGINSWPYEVE